MLKILMYGWEFPPHISGGLGVACHGIVSALAEHKLDISLVLPCVEDQSSDSSHIHLFDCRYNNLHDFSVDEVSHLKQFVNIKSVNSWLTPYMTSGIYDEVLTSHHLIQDPLRIQENDFFTFQGEYGSNLLDEVMRYAIVSGKYAKEIDHDIIHAHDWLTILAGIEAKRISNKPLIFQVHALETDRNPKNMNTLVYDIEKYGMTKADEIIAVSQYTKNCICEHYGISANKIKVVHNGILAKQFKGKKPVNRDNIHHTVLFLGRVTQQKGLYYFLEAARKVLAKRQDVDFVIAGKGDLWKDIIHQVAAWHLGKYIHFTNFLTKSKIDEIFKRTTIFLMPSISEPFGLVCLEAVAEHVPVIISKQSGVSEVMNHCLQVDFWDTDKIAENILELMNYPALAKEMAENAFKELPNLLWSKQVEKMIDIYNQWV